MIVAVVLESLLFVMEFRTGVRNCLFWHIYDSTHCWLCNMNIFVAVVSSYGRQPSEMLIHSLRTWLFVTNLLWLITHKPLFIDRYCSSIITRGRYTVILILDFSRFCPGDYSKSGPGEGFPVNIIHSYPGLHKTSRNKDLGYSLDVTRSPSSAHGLIYQGFPIEYQQLICWICTSLVIPESKFL